MERKMFCFQCEQTAGCTGCTASAGVCGKKADTALLQDQLTGALIGLAQAAAANREQVTQETDSLFINGLFSTLTNVNFDNTNILEQIARVGEEKSRLAQGANFSDYDMRRLWEADEDIRSLKSLILLGIRVFSAYAYPA